MKDHSQEFDYNKDSLNKKYKPTNESLLITDSNPSDGFAITEMIKPKFKDLDGIDEDTDECLSL